MRGSVAVIPNQPAIQPTIFYCIPLHHPPSPRAYANKTTSKTPPSPTLQGSYHQCIIIIINSIISKTATKHSSNPYQQQQQKKKKISHQSSYSTPSTPSSSPPSPPSERAGNPSVWIPRAARLLPVLLLGHDWLGVRG